MKIRSDKGSALIEAVGFVALACGLLLDSGLELFKLEKQQFELGTIARNSLREYLIYPTEDLNEIVGRWQDLSTEFSSSQIDFDLTCLNKCNSPSALYKFQLRSENLAVTAFAVSER